mgnify:CR=1 FL=1
MASDGHLKCIMRGRGIVSKLSFQIREESLAAAVELFAFVFCCGVHCCWVGKRERSSWQFRSLNGIRDEIRVMIMGG